MKRHSLTAALALAIVVPAGARSQQLTGTAKWADSASREIEAANEAGDLNRLTSAAAMIDRVLIAMPNDPLLLYYRSLALYRSATLYTGLKKNEEAKRVLDEADLLLEQATARAPTADALALRSSVLGLMIGLSGNPLSGMTLGPKSSDLLDRAKEIEPKNPRVWLISGMSAMFTRRRHRQGRAGCAKGDRVVRDGSAGGAGAVVGPRRRLDLAGSGSPEGGEDRRCARGISEGARDPARQPVGATCAAAVAQRNSKGVGDPCRVFDSPSCTRSRGRRSRRSTRSCWRRSRGWT
jgi:hypothetical protein